MKQCTICKKDITNQTSYRGKLCISCDNIKKKNKQLEFKNNPELKNIIKIKKEELELKCNKCLIILPKENFRGRRHICKKCENEYRKDFYFKNHEYEISRVKKYKNDNRDKINETRRLYKNKKYNTDIKFQIEACIRARFYQALNKNKKSESTFKYLGCTIEELKIWLEYNFQNNMTWDNYGKIWHIDHIKPCASFDFTNEKNIHKCFHWTNLAPLEASENIKKSDTINDELIKYYKNRKEEFIKSKSTHSYVLEPLIPS